MGPRARAAVVAALVAAAGAAGWWLGRTGNTPAMPTAPAASASHDAVTTHASPALALPNTTVHQVPDSVTGRRYEVWVDVPPSYAEGTRDYPVVVVTDAEYAFPVVRSLRRRVGGNGRNVEDFVLVGLSYAVGEASMPSKRRDYTPTDPFARGTTRSGDYARGQVYGHAEAYRDYIARDVFPLIARTYRVDMRRKVYIGHSLGGLFGGYVLLTRPDMFSHYVLGSPSLWFDERTLFTTEARYAASHRDLRANVRLSIGGFETIGTTPRHYRTVDMVGDMRDFERVLRARQYPGLRIESEVLPGLDHLTVFPDTATNGLLWALPGTGPYRGY